MRRSSQQFLDLVGELDQSQQIADGGARAPDGIRNRLMRMPEFLHQAGERARLLERIEILALDVFDQRHRYGGFVGNIAHDRRYFGEAGHLRGAPAALAGDDFIALRVAGVGARQRTHEYRLNQTGGFNRVRQFTQGLGAHIDPRLEFASLQQIDRQAGHAVAD